MFSLGINETDFTKVSFGYFIIKTVDKTPVIIITLDEAREAIRTSLLNEKQSMAYLTYMSGLWNAADMQVITPLNSAVTKENTASSISEAAGTGITGPTVQTISVE